MMTTSGRCGASSRRLGVYGHECGKFSRRITPHQRVSAKFYKAIVQSVLLYSRKTWNLTKTALARLEGFHIRAAYRMA